jgi:hypothetical protein
MYVVTSNRLTKMSLDSDDANTGEIIVEKNFKEDKASQFGTNFPLSVFKRLLSVVRRCFE